MKRAFLDQLSMNGFFGQGKVWETGIVALWTNVRYTSNYLPACVCYVSIVQRNQTIWINHFFDYSVRQKKSNVPNLYKYIEYQSNTPQIDELGAWFQILLLVVYKLYSWWQYYINELKLHESYIMLLYILN